jgi:hypothetical protein
MRSIIVSSAAQALAEYAIGRPADQIKRDDRANEGDY